MPDRIWFQGRASPGIVQSPESASYENSYDWGAAVYTVSEQTSGTGTTAAVKVQSSLIGGRTSYSAPEYTLSVSGVYLTVSHSVYLSESVQIAFTSATSGLESVTAHEDFGFSEPGAGCSLALDGVSSPQSCSTGEVFVGAGSQISVGSNLWASAFTENSGDAGSFNGIATLGPLDVYDLNGNLIETVELGPTVSAPEPAVGIFSAVLITAAALGRRVKRSKKQPSRT